MLDDSRKFLGGRKAWSGEAGRTEQLGGYKEMSSIFADQ